MERKIQVIDADYEVRDGEPVIRLFGRSVDGENVLVEKHGFLPYFYAVPSGEPGELAEEIDSTEFEHEDEQLVVEGVEVVERSDGNETVKAIKVESDLPPSIPKLRSEIDHMEGVEECREFDIPFYKRYLIDSGIRPMETVAVTGEAFESDSFDLALELEDIHPAEGEVDYTTMAFDLEVYQDEIIMVSLVAESLEKVVTSAEIDGVETVEGEKEIIQRFMEIVKEQDVDILTGYNTDEFDFDVLRDRAEEHGLELSLGRDGERMKFNRRGRFSSARLKGRMHLDLYPFVTHILSPSLDAEMLDLDSVASEVLGEHKEDMSWEEMKEAWREKKDLKKFADYCLKDSELAFQLASELVPQVIELSRITGLIPFDAARLTYGQLTENYLLREAQRRKMLAPNRPSNSQRKRRRSQGAYEGGFVYTPEAGLYEDIALFDFRSLYPTVMVAHNISPDTLEVEPCEEEFEIGELGYSFCQDDQGFFPDLVEELVSERYQLKKEQQNYEEGSQKYKNLYNREQAEKILANSFYGYMGYPGARWYSRESAEATTYLGRKYIEDTIDTAREMGFEVVYGDTDSVFLKKDDIRNEIQDFLERVNSELPEFMELEYEGFYSRGFFTSTESGEGAKKKYALLDPDGEMKVTGFEQVRRDWSPIAKETQERVLRKVLEGEPEKAAELVKDTIDRLKNGGVPVEKLRIYTTLTKKPENYDSTAPHVEAVKKAEERGDEISPGSTVQYVITKGGGSISSRAELTRYAEDYDAGYYVDNQVIPVALRVLKEFGYTEGQLKGKGRQSGLDRFD
ncbi:MAG: DNA-directed DNA polymerase [Candidatus Nanohaloarchaea archaeon]